MSRKLYFQRDSDRCYNLQYHFEYMEKNNLKELTVFRGIPDFDSGMFYCAFVDEIGEKNKTCNKRDCDCYFPKHGQKGRCKFYCYAYRITGEIKILIDKN